MRQVLAVLCQACQAAVDQTLDDRHLPLVPRTEAEKVQIAAALKPVTDFTKHEAFKADPAGSATVRASQTAGAFAQFSANMRFEHEMRFKMGNGILRKIWVAPPETMLASDGLGPLYNARACQD